MTDLDQQAFLEATIRTHEHNLRHLQLQASKHGTLAVPLPIINQIRDEEAALNQRKLELAHLNGGPELPPPPPPSLPAVPSGFPAPLPDKVLLRRVLTQVFNENDLRDLMFDLNINYEDLGGSGTGAKARELIMYMERHGRYPELVDHVKALRPHVQL